MDLYRIGTRYVGTQADARALAKESGVRFDPDANSAKVPTDKAGLIEYLNGLLTEAPQSPEPATPPGPPAPVAHLPARAVSLTDLEEAIQNADGFALGRLLDNVVARLEELRREAKLPARAA